MPFLDRLRYRAPVTPAVADGLLALGLGAGAVAHAWTGPDGQLQPAAVLAATGATVPLAVRRRAPLLVLAAIVFSRSVHWLIAPGADSESLFEFLAVLLALYSVAAHRPWPDTAAAVGLALAGLLLQVSLFSSPEVGDVGGAAVVYAVVVAGGRGMWRRHDEAAALRERAERLQQERAAAVHEERMRIARDLHDIVGHSLAVMVLQAGAAQRLVDDRPEPLRAALGTIEVVGREAAGDLQRALGLLRGASGNGWHEGERAPQTLETLTAPLRSAGIGVQVRGDDTLQALPPAVALSAYRVIQESLTNVLKHADARAVEVTVRRAAAQLEVVVDDDGRGLPDDAGRVVGHGLLGMEERVRLFGGRLDVSTGDKGGVSVRAVLPLEQLR